HVLVVRRTEIPVDLIDTRLYGVAGDSALYQHKASTAENDPQPIQSGRYECPSANNAGFF
ncbi:hypothetical protein, partial [Mycobacteroides abscessus]|uniref:hypothetical protein n=1 Tax=Mycobacteroides abscessus TaxID=36809 RepID=UPI003CEB55F5